MKAVEGIFQTRQAHADLWSASALEQSLHKPLLDAFKLINVCLVANDGPNITAITQDWLHQVSQSGCGRQPRLAMCISGCTHHSCIRTCACVHQQADWSRPAHF